MDAPTTSPSTSSTVSAQRTVSAQVSRLPTVYTIHEIGDIHELRTCMYALCLGGLLCRGMSRTYRKMWACASRVQDRAKIVTFESEQGTFDIDGCFARLP